MPLLALVRLAPKYIEARADVDNEGCGQAPKDHYADECEVPTWVSVATSQNLSFPAPFPELVN